LAGLPIGLTITAIIFSVGPITGAALNPARWFGPALISGDWSNAWLYIFAPILGGVMAAVTYQSIAKPE
jgi:glycerol uptake facilitator-like aquaporin